MITVGMNYNVVAGKESEFENAFAKVLEVMSKIPGHRETHLYRNVSAPNRYLIHSEWADRSAFDAFIASDQFRNVTDWGKREILAARPRHEIYGQASDSAPPGGGQCPVSHG